MKVSAREANIVCITQFHRIVKMSEGWISPSVEKKTEADEASKSKQRKRSKTTVSIGDMPLTSQKKTNQKKKHLFPICRKFVRAIG